MLHKSREHRHVVYCYFFFFLVLIIIWPLLLILGSNIYIVFAQEQLQEQGKLLLSDCWKSKNEFEIEKLQEETYPCKYYI